MKGKVIFIDSVHPILFERLEQAGYVCEWKNNLNRNQILEILPEYTGAVIRSKFKFDSEVFDRAEDLKWIARSGAGMENIDLVLAKEKNIRCYNSPEGNRDAVAEHAMGMILSLFNRLNQADAEVRLAQWNREKNRGIELRGKTVGIIGYGFMGEAFAQRLSGFGVGIMAHDKYKTGFGANGIEESSLEQIQAEADILSIHLPLTEETTGYVNHEFLDAFQKPIYLINTARGKNLIVSDLLDAMDTGKVLGACLDVLEYESISFENINADQLPADFKRLADRENVLLSPHVAGWTQESYEKLSSVLAEKILGEH